MKISPVLISEIGPKMIKLKNNFTFISVKKLGQCDRHNPFLGIEKTVIKIHILPFRVEMPTSPKFRRNFKMLKFLKLCVLLFFFVNKSCAVSEENEKLVEWFKKLAQNDFTTTTTTTTPTTTTTATRDCQVLKTDDEPKDAEPFIETVACSDQVSML